MNTAQMTRLLAPLFLVASAALPMRAQAGDFPLASGDFWDMTGVRLKDGGSFAYAKFLATEWRADQEYAKSKGWIKSYTILSNNNRRKGEPDLYLVTVFERMPSGPEGEKRNDEYLAWRKKTDAQLTKEFGDRLEIRELEGGMLLQELKIK